MKTWFKTRDADAPELTCITEAECNAALTARFGRRRHSVTHDWINPDRENLPNGEINWTRSTEAVTWLESQLNLTNYKRYQRALAANSFHMYPGTPRKAAVIAYTLGLFEAALA